MFESAVVAESHEVSRAASIAELQARIRRMQRNRLDTRELPTHPALAGLLPGGALAAGSAYGVTGSTTLALGMLQGPSAAGAWCAVVGMPDLGVESAAGLGIDLERLVLVPHPGEQWLAVLSALIDVVSVVLVRPGGTRVSEGVANKLAARLRQREAVLVAVGDWPGASARLAVADSSWAGLGSGFGHLSGRQVTVTATSPAGRPVSRRLWLPGHDQGLGEVETRAGGLARAV
ncbi:MAG TPA: hypothetical protein VNR36_07225 [Pseudolysinimonas sp.]|nr:hypothetical protein [Pseudolysinimonas sp.]